MSAVDVSTLAVRVTSDGIKETADGLNKVFKEAKKAEDRVVTLTDKIGKLSSAFQAGTASAQAYQTAVANANRVVGGHDAATTALTQAMKQLNGSMLTLSTNLGQVDTRSRQSTQATRFHTEAMRDAHAAARGLSGSLGALWVTYGNMIPLAAGLAIGASFKGIVTLGKDVEHTLEGIRVRGNETVATIETMRSAIMTLGQGVYGPKEVADAFQTLILAGLTAKEAMTGIKDALNLAIVGGTSIEKAASTLVQVSTSLGYTAAGFGRVSDVIAATAAASMSSVDSLSEAFKSASAVGKLYGATLVDIGTGLGALSQLGIQGSAAGTSLKNFYKELSTESDKLKRVLGSMNMVPADLKDSEGKFLDLVTVIKKLDTGLSGLKPAQQELAKDMMANERGIKSLVEFLDLYRKKTEDGSNALVDFRTQIEQSYGMAALGAAQMALTVDSQFKSVKNTLQTSLVGAFKEIEPQLLVFAAQLKNIFNSEQFKTAIQTIAISLADFAVVVANNVDKIVLLVEGFIAFKGAMLALGIIQTVSAAVTGMAAALTALGIAATTANIALGVIGITLGVVAAAWAYYHSQKDQSDTKQAQALTSLEEYNKQLSDEATRMKSVNDELALGVSKKDADARVTQQQAIAMAELNKQKLIGAAQDKVNQAMSASLNGPTSGPGYQRNIYALQVAQANLVEAEAKGNSLLTSIRNNIDQVEREARVTAAYEEKRIKDQQAAIKGGDGVVGGKPEKGHKMSMAEKDFYHLVKLAEGYEAKAKAIEAAGATELKTMADTEQARIKGLISEGAYNDAHSKHFVQRLQEEAKKADLAKFELDKQTALSEMGFKITKQMSVENAAIAEANAGHSKLVGTLEAEARELMRIWGIDPDGERAKKMLEEARATGELTAKREKMLKFQKETETLVTEAGSLKDQAQSLDLYGNSGKQTALQLAKLKIEQAGLSVMFAEGAINARNAAAAAKDVETANRDLAKFTADLNDKNKEIEAKMLADILSSESEKVIAKRETMLKAIEFSYQQAEAARDAGIVAKAWTEEQEAAYGRMLERRKTALEAVDKNTKLGLDNAAMKDSQNLLTDIKDLAKSLEESFGNAGKALGGVLVGMQGLDVAQKQYNASLAIADDIRKTNPANASKVEQEAIKMNARAQVKGYADMAGAAKGFFNENSKGYKVLHAAEQTFRAFELAMAMENFLTKSGLMAAFTGLFVTAKTTEVAAETASVAPTLAAEGVKQTAFGITGLAAALSLPFPANIPAFAIVAAMLAAIGVAVGGGSGKSSSISKERQAANGTGTVFGNENAKSESIAKSIDLLANNSNIALEYTSGMLSSLKNIEANISGLATMVVQASGLRGTRADVKALDLKAPGNFLSALFGGKTQTLLDTGISVASQKIGDAVKGIAAQTYAEIQTTRKVLGITISNKKETRYGELNAGLKDQFTRVLGDIVNGVVDIAEQFGQKGSTVRDVINALDIDLKEISFKDLTGEEIQKELEALFSSIGDKVSAAALATLGLEAFQKTGEGFMQTAIRVSSGIESAKFELDKLGIQAVDYTKITQKQGDVAAEIFRDSVLQTQKLGDGLTGVGQIMSTMTGTVTDLAGTFAQLLAVQQSMVMVGMNGGALGRSMIYGAGDLASLQSGFDTYFENFFSANEQLQAKTSQLKLKFEALGVAMPASKEGFRALISSIPTATAEGQKLVGQLLLLADGFNDVSQMAKEAKNDALDKAFSALERSVDAEKKRLTDAYDAEVKRLKKKAEDDIEAAKLGLKPAEEALKSIQSIFDALKNAIKSTVVESAALSAVRRKEAQNVLSGALGFSNTGGSLVGYGGFDEALQTIAKPSENLFTSFEDYARDQAITAQVLEGLATNAKKQVSAAQLTIDAINGTIDAIKTASDAELEALENRHNADLDRLDNILVMAQREIDAINGVDNSVKSVEAALREFNATLAAAGSKSSVNSNGSSTISTINGVGTITQGKDSATLTFANGGSHTVSGAGAADLLRSTYAGSASDNPNPSANAQFVESLYSQFLGRSSDSGGLANWTAALTSGAMSATDVIQGFINSDEYHSRLPSLDVGTNSVPIDMTANIHEGERIIPRADNVELMRRLSEPNGSKEEREALAAAIIDLKQTIISGDVANVQQARELLKLIRKWDGEGMPEVRDVIE